MSDIRIALIAEGPTDSVIIEAALKAILPRPFVLTQLQPEPTRPDMGNGWGGVFKWCREFRLRGVEALENDPILGNFDLVIVHLDADVAEKFYADCGDAVVEAAQGLPALPCSTPCPPIADTVDSLRAVLLEWLGLPGVGNKSVLCIPSKASEAWLATAILPVNHALLTGIECNLNLEPLLAQLPIKSKLRVKKSTREYRTHASKITSGWAQIKSQCTQANMFDQQIKTAYEILAA